MKILIAEDDPVARLMLKAAIEKQGHETLCASDGSEALRLFREEPTRIIISDWMMPGLDGLELCSRIREKRSLDYIYFILLTANNETAENYRRAMDAGVDDMLVKPFDRERIALRLKVAERIVNYSNQIQQLESLLPICMYCKKIRDRQGDYWEQLEAYIHTRTGSDFSHGICPDCYSEHVESVLLRQSRREVTALSNHEG